MINILKIFIKACFISTKRFFTEKYTYRVSALSFTTLLGIVPLFAISVFFITLFPSFSNLSSLAESYILQNFIPHTASIVDVYFHNFIKQVIKLPWFSIIFLVFTVFMMIYTVDETMNEIWRAQKRRKKIIIWIIYCLIILLTPLFIGFSVFLTSYLVSFNWLFKIDFILLFCLPILINTVLFSLLFILAPDVNVKWRFGFLGGFITAILFEIAKMAFSFYITKFSNYTVVYGAMAIIPIFFVWVYICWFIVLWGAFFTHTIATEGRKL